MQIDNRTSFSGQAILLPNVDGFDTLYTIIKATFKIGQKWTLEEDQPLPQGDDEYWGEPEDSSLKNAMGIHIGKPATDVAIIGLAYAPKGQRVSEIDVGASVGKLQSVVRVFDDRHWVNCLISKPKPFQKMPKLYENAHGGKLKIDDIRKSIEQKNAVGKRHKSKRSNAGKNGTLLPNIEDPRNLISTTLDTSEPAGWGFRAPHWYLRVQHGRTYDASWKKQSAPYVPKYFSPRFNNSAHQNLVCTGYMEGANL